jgi:hypothetical protein
MNRKKWIVIVFALALAALACAGLPNFGDIANNAVGTVLATTGLDELAEMATLIATSGLSDDAQGMMETMMAGGTVVPVETLMAQFGDQVSGSVIYQDDFSDFNSGWPSDDFTEGSTGYYNGQYHIVVNETNYAVWAASSTGVYGDVIVEADGVKLGGPDENEFGLLCRFVDNGNFYAATIASDGYYFIWRRINNGDWEMVGMETGEFSEAIHTGTQSNRIRLECIGSSLTLYANGTLLRQVQDSSLTSGDVGLYAGTFEEAGTDVLFDNFVITQP